MLLKADRIACERGGRRIFSDLSFTVSAGEFLELRGSNGAGKSSLLRMLAGFNKPAAGHLKIEAEAAYVGHLDAIKPALTVHENLAFWHDYFGDGDVDAAIAAFALAPMANDPAALLSQGQKRRLALSRLALQRKPIWLLDEPASSLDAASFEKLRQLMIDHVQAGGMIVAATHTTLGLTPSQTLTLGSRT
jgi:heme exporter protein A